MKVELARLKPNPHRDFTIDPIDAETVDKLAESISQDGFWGGVVCRKTKNGIEIAAGHHRIAAAIKSGIVSADLFIGPLDDAAMIRIYARENATQRGNSGTALTGSVASAVRFLIRVILTDEGFSEISDKQNDLKKLQGNISSAKGLGAPMIEQFLSGVPGINRAAIDGELANLKKSGNYARIVHEVTAAIEEEKREAFAELKRLEAKQAKAQKEAEEAQAKADRITAEVEKERAKAEAEFKASQQAQVEAELAKLDTIKATRDNLEQAAASVNGDIRTFDFEGVAQYFKNPSQVKAFRDLVLSDLVQRHLPVEQQAGLAAELVRLAKSTEEEVTARFIKENIVSLVLDAQRHARKLSQEEQARLEAENIHYLFKRLEDEFGLALRNLISSGHRITQLLSEHQSVKFTLSGEVRKQIKAAKVIVNQLSEHI